MCNTGCLPPRNAARKPVNRNPLPTACLASVSASVPKATARISTFTSRFSPASRASDSCSSTRSMAGSPAGGWRGALASAIRALRIVWFTPDELPPCLRLELRLLRLAGFLALHGLHHGGRARVGLLLDHGQVAQHGVVEAEGVLELA